MKGKKKSIIGVGIDQGIANLGFSVVKLRENDEVELLESGTLVTKSNYPMSQRTLIIYQEITRLVAQYPVDIIGCEKLFFNAKSNNGRNKSASIVYTNMATGILYLIAGQTEIPLQQFVPGTVKKFLTGNGRADKDLLEESVLNNLVNKEDILTNKPFKSDHESDSVGIGITAVKYYRENEEELIKSNRHIKPKKKKGVKKQVV